MGYMRSVACLLFFLSCVYAEENFYLINGTTNEIVSELGPHIDERITPGSTFKIALSLMGYDSGVLIDKQTPIWEFQEGYEDFLMVWKEPQTPESWMKNSCVWYSRVLASKLGLAKLQNYLALLDYGNQDISGGLTQAWLSSSLKISTKEQANFIQKMVIGNLPVSTQAIQITKSLLFKEELPDGWKLFGKTGWSGPISGSNSNNFEIGWFVGWIEKENQFYPFAYHIRDEKIDLAQRIPRVKELLLILFNGYVEATKQTHSFW